MERFVEHHEIERPRKLLSDMDQHVTPRTFQWYSLYELLIPQLSSFCKNASPPSSRLLWIVRNQRQQDTCLHIAIGTSTAQHPVFKIARPAASIYRCIVYHSSTSGTGRCAQIVSVVECTGIDTSSEVRALGIWRRRCWTSSVAIEVGQILTNEIQPVVDSIYLAWI